MNLYYLIIKKIMQQTSFLSYPHKKQFIYEITQKVSFCSNCSSAIITDISGDKVSTIKPLKYHIPKETSIPNFLTISDMHEPYFFLNKSDFIKIRKQIIKNMKDFCNYFQLNKKTFFLSLDYFDRICSRMKGFDIEALKQIFQICIILACKYLENQSKAIEIKKLSGAVSSNYAKDELFLLKLLNYDLHVFTSYDILMEILYCGFLFNDENFSLKKMNSIFNEIENILFLFAESKFYIDMTHKEVAIAIMGFVRETLGLAPFNKNIRIVFMNEYVDIHNYLSCLNKLKKCFKLKIDNHQNINNSHSDSNTDSNSDNNSDNKSEINSDNNDNLGNRIVNNRN